MSAYLVGNITVVDDTLWQQYVAGVQESLAPFDAELVFRGKRSRVLAGEHDHDLIVVIRFTDQATLDDWFESKIYQSLIPLRGRAADVVITTYTV